MRQKRSATPQTAEAGQRRSVSVSDASRRGSVLANVFPAAQAAVDDWGTPRRHSGGGERLGIYKPHSSQALVVDVFGTLQAAPGREAVLDRWALELGLPAGGPWEVTLEWRDPENHLREQQPTWVDAVARSPHALIFFEGKFTEGNGGRCSQPGRLKSGPHKGLRQCTGSYMWQVNPVDGAEARCALTAKGIRYWDLVPRVFDYDPDQSYLDCPFAGPWFQWMRNLTVCFEVARHAGLRPAVVVAYADGPGLPMAARVRSAEWARLLGRLQPDAVAFRALPFQTLIAWAQQAARADPVWPDLAAWVQAKIDAVCAGWTDLPQG